MEERERTEEGGQGDDVGGQEQRAVRAAAELPTPAHEQRIEREEGGADVAVRRTRSRQRRRYQTESQRASGEKSTSAAAPSGWVSAGSSNFWAFSAARPPLAGPKESAAKMATRSTAPRVAASTRHAARTASEPLSAAAGRAGAGVASNAMPVTDFYSASVLEEHKEQIYAVVTVVAGAARGKGVDRALARRGAQHQHGRGRAASSPVATHPPAPGAGGWCSPRIILIGAGRRRVPIRGLSSVAKRDPRLLRGARPRGRLRRPATLANGMAGILLAITQPIRIGDLVTFEGRPARSRT